MERRFIHPSELMDSKGRYGFSQVVRVANPGALIFLSGQGPTDRSERVVGGDDIEAQARATFKRIETALAAAGASCKDIVKMTIYCDDIEAQKAAIRKVRAEFLDGENPPASTFIEVSKFAVPGMRIEVDVIAAVA